MDCMDEWSIQGRGAMSVLLTVCNYAVLVLAVGVMIYTGAWLVKEAWEIFIKEKKSE